MKKITVVAMVLAAFLAMQFLGVSQAAAAKVDTDKGTRALVFQFSGLSDLGAGAYRSGIGMRYYIQNGLALRPGLRFDMLSHKTKSGSTTLTDAKETDMAVGFSLAIEKHAAGVGSLSPYIGAEAGVNMFSNKTEPSHAVGATYESTDKGMSFGVGGLAGFEWGFSEGVTLGAEYTLGLSFGSGKTESKVGSTTTTTDDTSGMAVGFGTASFYLSVNW
jgi:hypothetical protein